MAELVFVLVVAARLLVPLGIPRRPLPFILAALVLDAADQTIFQAVDATSVLDEYQSYDKALDVYYLTIAYVSTLRNWVDPFALQIARFLFYYRLVGTLAFELADDRTLLLVFPNTFEYFFVFYEAVRLWWDPNRMRHRLLVGTAAGIWVFIKLPQEFWIHVAELDVTDEAGRHPWLLPSFFGALALLALVAHRVLRDRVPPPDRRPTAEVDTYVLPPPDPAGGRRAQDAVLSLAVLEKVLLLATIVVIFSQVLTVRATDLELVVGVAAVVVLNAAVSLYRAPFGGRFGSTLAMFGAMFAINGAILGVGILLRRTAGIDAYLRVGDALFFLLLLSLLIAMYDRYRGLRLPVRARRSRAAG